MIYWLFYGDVGKAVVGVKQDSSADYHRTVSHDGEVVCENIATSGTKEEAHWLGGFFNVNLIRLGISILEEQKATIALSLAVHEGYKTNDREERGYYYLLTEKGVLDRIL